MAMTSLSAVRFMVNGGGRLFRKNFHSGGRECRIVFHDERSRLEGRSKFWNIVGIGLIAGLLSGERVEFGRRSEGFRGKFPRKGTSGGSARFNEEEPPHEGEVVARSLDLRTAFALFCFVGIASVRTFPNAGRGHASANGVRGKEASVPKELPGQIALPRIVDVVHLVRSSVVTHEASFGISGTNDVGYLRGHVDVASFGPIRVVAEHDEREHGIRIGIMQIGVEVYVSSSDDDGLFSGDGHFPVSGSSPGVNAAKRYDTSGIAVDFGSRKLGEIVVGYVFRKIGDRNGTKISVIGRKSSDEIFDVFPDVAPKLSLIHGLSIDGNP